MNVTVAYCLSAEGADAGAGAEEHPIINTSTNITANVIIDNLILPFFIYMLLSVFPFYAV